MVWDLPLRLFHWFLVVCVTIAGVTGFLAPAWWLDVHVYAGYGLGILLAFRLAWGLVGSPYSKFSAFPLRLSSVRRHLITLISRKPDSQVDFDPQGHNPVGAWVIVVMIGVLILLVATGLAVLGGQEKLGPLAFLTSYQFARLVKELHEILAWGLGGALAIHLSGVFAETVLFRHPVLKAMVTGRKPALAGDANVGGQGPIGRGAVVFTLVAATLIGLAAMLAERPAFGWRTLATPAVYSSECRDCHPAYHPSLRNAPAWRSIIAGLGDHYGEDASIDAASATAIENFLTTNAAGTFDTQAANRIGRVGTSDFRITRTPYWKRRHHDIPSAVYRQKNIGSKVNCNGCHRDADSGLYANSEIHIPDGVQK